MSNVDIYLGMRVSTRASRFGLPMYDMEWGGVDIVR